MPIAESVRGILTEQNVKPIGAPIPDFDHPQKNQPTLLELLADKCECTIVETGSPIGSRMQSLAREAGITNDLDTLVTQVTTSEEGMERMEKFIRHQAVRRAPINPLSALEGPKLTGHETYFIAQPILGGYVDDPHAMALTIALEGLALQKGHTDQIPQLLQLITRYNKEREYNPAPLQAFLRQLLSCDDDETIRRLQSRGFQQMPLDQLREINTHLATILSAEQTHMDPFIPPTKEIPQPHTAANVRQRILDSIRSHPAELRHIYYFQRGQDVRILYAVPKIQDQLAALHAPSITQAAKIAQSLELPLQQEYIDILYELIKMISRGIEPVTRHILEYSQ
jgi:hypothetical protein